MVLGFFKNKTYKVDVNLNLNYTLKQTKKYKVNVEQAGNKYKLGSNQARRKEGKK